MPTGYTSNIYENKDVSFEDFVLTCALAFGACFHQRDDNMRDKPKLRELDIKYHLDALERAKNNKIPTKVEFEALRKEEIDEAHADMNKYANLRERYESMLQKAESWNPPTPKHDGLKKFMIQQLEDSIKFDCNEEYCNNNITIWKNEKYSDYVKALEESNKKSIKCHTEDIEKEKKSVETTNKWITDLYGSLNA